MAVLTPWVVASRDAAVTGVASINGKQGDVTLEEAGIAASGANKDITSLEGLVGPLRLNAQGVDDYDAVTVGQLNAASTGGGGVGASGVMSDFIGAVQWWNGSATAIPSGYVAANGQILNRADYPDLWALVNSGKVNVSAQGSYASTDEAWLNTPTGRGGYSKGDDSTTFRVPDLNGVFNDGQHAASIPGLFIRGSGVANLAGYSTGGLGTIRKAATPDVVGGFATMVPVGHGSYCTGGMAASNGSAVATTNQAALYACPPYGDTTKQQQYSDPTIYGYQLAASRYNNVYGQDAITAEVRPSSVTGVWIIRANGNVTSANTDFNIIRSDESLPAAGTTVNTGVVKTVYDAGDAEMFNINLYGSKVIGSQSSDYAVLGINDGESNSSTFYRFVWNGKDNQVATTGDVTSVKSLMEERLVEMEAMVAAQAETIRLLNMRHSAFEARMKALEQEVVNGRVSEE